EPIYYGEMAFAGFFALLNAPLLLRRKDEEGSAETVAVQAPGETADKEHLPPPQIEAQPQQQAQPTIHVGPQPEPLEVASPSTVSVAPQAVPEPTAEPAAESTAEAAPSDVKEEPTLNFAPDPDASAAI